MFHVPVSPLLEEKKICNLFGYFCTQLCMRLDFIKSRQGKYVGKVHNPQYFSDWKLNLYTRKEK